jgi:hypothetical protein
MMQAYEGCGDGIFLGSGDPAGSKRFALNAGHGDQGRVRVQIGSDGLRRKSGRIACEQFQRLPLATGLSAMKPPLITIDVRPKALDRDSLLEGDAMGREGAGPRHGSGV